MHDKQKTSLVWFQNDLRTHDQISLARAMAKGNRVIGVFFFVPSQFEIGTFGFKKTEKFRAKFLLETIQQLEVNLAQLNISLLTFFDSPEKVFPLLVTEYEVTEVFLQKEWTQEELDRLNRVKNVVAPNVTFTESFDQFLFHPEDVPLSFNQIPQVFTQFRKICEKKASVRNLVPFPKAMPKENTIHQHSSIPSLNELGYEEFDTDARTAFPFQGGENEALNRLDHYFWESKKLSVYKKTRNGLIGTDYSSKFSPWLANGSLSPRTVYHKIKEYEKEIVKNDSTYWLFFELIWRDYFKYISLKHGNAIFRQEGILEKEYEWKTDLKLLHKWINGETSSSFVNANMLEIKNTGWMSNRGRQNVASYFAKELLLDWRIGAAYFEAMLLDYDVHSNYGNWMYVAGVGNDPRDRKFNVRLQAERYDAQGKFQTLWLQNSLF
ncbi:DASH family cryptochrome [Cytophaga sp. FL35]|uniref:DASH family cryptochrome n=1 Tax=Cytophaga sp. FL35 TaxID=1904456 RepID=UPI0016538F3E|nr:DASH family cryptochrome [Cytophaga sp. FL35]MBC6999424.1 DASH family cryptochrome [Cytophaga sp. FL35]